MPRHCYVLRVFTRGDEGGNHLGVVTDATGLTADSMQAIAVELGFSETIFLDWEQEEVPRGADLHAREPRLPFAGHPLVGMAWTLKNSGPVVPIRCSCRGLRRMRSGSKGTERRSTFPLISRCVRLPSGARGRGGRSARAGFGRWVDMPVPYLLIEAESPAAVASATPAPEDVFPGGRRRHGLPVRIRVTRSGAGPVLCSRTRRFRGSGDRQRRRSAGRRPADRRPDLRANWQVSQGSEIGHPSTINLPWDAGRARIGGTVRKDEVRWLET